MFEQIGSFDQAFPSAGNHPRRAPRHQASTTVAGGADLLGANLLVMPIVGTIYATIIAEGLRQADADLSDSLCTNSRSPALAWPDNTTGLIA